MDIHKKTIKRLKKSSSNKKTPKSSAATSTVSFEKTANFLGESDQLQQVKPATKTKYKSSASAGLKTDISKPVPDASSEIMEEPNKKSNPLVGSQSPDLADIEKIYPLLKDSQLIAKFMAVPMNNNQKGRIRQLVREDLKSNYQGAETGNFDPRVLSLKIQAIISKRDELTESDLRKIRILHNMLRFSTQPSSLATMLPKKKKNKKSKNKKRKLKDGNEILVADSESPEVPLDSGMVVEVGKQVLGISKENITKVGTNVEVEKVKGPKRYVVFLGNLPYLTDKDKIRDHFVDITNDIKDIRIPQLESKKGGIAYLELGTESSYQLALSKHHSMMGNRRINVLYTTAGKKKMEMSDVKVKTAKLLALQKSGRLLGSIPQNKKRSFRRKKQREALSAIRAV